MQDYQLSKDSVQSRKSYESVNWKKKVNRPPLNMHLISLHFAKYAKHMLESMVLKCLPTFFTFTIPYYDFNRQKYYLMYNLWSDV